MAFISALTNIIDLYGDCKANLNTRMLAQVFFGNQFTELRNNLSLLEAPFICIELVCE